MSSVLAEPVPASPSQDAGVETFADVLDRLGGIFADRVLTRPAPEAATENDLLRLPDGDQKTCELIDNTLVRKAAGAPESEMAMNLVHFLAVFTHSAKTKTIRILSAGNTRCEIDKKLRTFFDSGVRLAWVVDPRQRTVRVYTSAEDFTEVTEDGLLNAADILPGFTLSVHEWFEESE